MPNGDRFDRGVNRMKYTATLAVGDHEPRTLRDENVALHVVVNIAAHRNETGLVKPDFRILSPRVELQVKGFGW